MTYTTGSIWCFASAVKTRNGSRNGMSVTTKLFGKDGELPSQPGKSSNTTSTTIRNNRSNQERERHLGKPQAQSTTLFSPDINAQR